MPFKLDDLFPDTPAGKNIQSTNNRKLPSEATSHTIYPLVKFNRLEDAVKSIPGAKVDRFRYLVDTAGQLWLAAEGSAGSKIPAHYQLTGMTNLSAKCLAAGNLIIKDNQLIINHKSGDFHPPFASIFHLLIILANTETLPFEYDHLTIKELTSSGGEKQSYDIEAGDLRPWGEKFAAQVKSQPLVERTVSYSGSRLNRVSRYGTGAAERLNFFGGVEAEEKTTTPSSARVLDFSALPCFDNH